MSLYLFCTYTHNSKGITSHDERSYPFLVVAGTGIVCRTIAERTVLTANHVAYFAAAISGYSLPLSTISISGKILSQFLDLPSTKDQHLFSDFSLWPS
jgi:hypothetical protein